MSDTKFTPGPWVVKSNGHYFDIGQDYKHACKEVPVYPTACIGVPHELEDNAHLIAAAPELYEALESARTWVDDCGAQAGLQHILDEIDAALAKARGES